MQRTHWLEKTEIVQRSWKIQFARWLRVMETESYELKATALNIFWFGILKWTEGIWRKIIGKWGSIKRGHHMGIWESKGSNVKPKRQLNKSLGHNKINCAGKQVHNCVCALNPFICLSVVSYSIIQCCSCENEDAVIVEEWSPHTIKNDQNNRLFSFPNICYIHFYVEL